MKIEKIKLADLKPLEKNVRKHNDIQVNELIRSLNQFGQTRAIIVDEDNNILIGNGLYMAMVKRGDTEAECSRVTGLTETQKKKLVLTDNKVYSLGLDDYENIEAFINDIALDGDFDIAGFDEDILKQMTRELNEVSRDVANYGLIPDDYVKPQAPAPATSTPQNTEVNTYHEETVQPHALPQQQTAVKRSVICPSCGEVIYID